MRFAVTLLLFAASLGSLACRQDRDQLNRSATVSERIILPPRGILRDVCAQTYAVTTTPRDLPRDVQAALAKDSGSQEMEMAAAGAPYNFGCLITPGLPRERLIAAATNGRFCVVHFEQGGLAGVRRVIVFRRNLHGTYAQVAWSGESWLDLPTAKSFLAAVRSGALFSEGL